MYTSHLPYQVFESDDSPAGHQRILEAAVSGIRPLYFETNPRFKALGKVSAPTLVDSLFVYEEGSRWDMTIVRVLASDNLPRYLFLPLVADIVSDAPTMIGEFVPLDLGDVAFGLQTYSPAHGVRDWKVVDAFSDFGFLRKLIHSFLSWEPLDENHPNAYTEFVENGIGKFDFSAISKFEADMDGFTAILPKLLDSGDTSLQYGELYRLIVHGNLPVIAAGSALQSTANIWGRITYSGPGVPGLLIGDLERL